MPITTEERAARMGAMHWAWLGALLMGLAIVTFINLIS